MRLERLPRLGFILAAVLLGTAGCGRRSALRPTDGGIDEAPDGTGATADGTDTNDARDAQVTLEGGALSDASDALTPTPDAATDAPPSLPPNRYRAIAISFGSLEVCAILDDHRLKCWGENDLGQLGLGDTEARGSDATTMGDNLPTVDLGTGRTAKAVAAGKYTTCAILDDDTVKCWGVVPSSIDPDGKVGGAPGEMGDNLKAIDLGAGRRPVAVTTGWGGTCVALDDRSFRCWQGSGTPVTVMAATDGARVVQLTRDYAPLGVFDDGSVRRISDTSPSGPTPVDFGGRPATFVAGPPNDGNIIDCVILRAGGTACTNSSLAPVPADASAMSLAITLNNRLCGLDSSGAVTCWDDSSSGGLESHPEWRVAEGTYQIPLGQPATAIGAGNWDACALLVDGTVRCWGIEVVNGDPYSLGGSVATATGVSAVDLGTRPAP